MCLASFSRPAGAVMNEQFWTVARFPNGSWSTGGSPDSPDYEMCHVYRVIASGEKDAKRKGQALHRKYLRGKSKFQEGQ